MHRINYKDFSSVINSAKDEMSKITLPTYITDIKLENKEVINLCLIESFIKYLNKNNLLNKNIEIDFTNEDSNDSLI